MAKTNRKTVRGKGKTIEQKIRSGLDVILLEIVREGQVVEDDDGNLIRAHPSAAMLKVIGDRVKDWERTHPKLETPQEALQRRAIERRASDGGNPVGAIGPSGLGLGRDG